MKSRNEKRFLCWGTPVYSSWEISDALSSLNVTHTVRVSRLQPPRLVNLKHAQPRMVHVTDRVTDMRESYTNFISASYADLGHTNIPKFPDEGQYPLDLALKMMLESSHPETSLVLSSPTALEYVAMLSKPSLLNNIQTLIYKIQPYSLRKETQAIMLRYFTGQVSRQTVTYFLKRSFKTADLIEFVDKGVDLRNAVIRTKTEPVEKVAKETGIASFDLIYLGKERAVKPPKEPKKKVSTVPNSMRNSADGKMVKF